MTTVRRIRTPPASASDHRPGRAPATTHAELERAGIRLFTENGFTATSVKDIAAAAGISRRTFFRYFPSKSDVVWGDFDAAVHEMEAHLRSMPRDIPLMEALRRAVVRFNTVPAAQEKHHRQRLQLILQVPELIAHSTLRFSQWRRVVDQFAAARLGLEADDLLPRTIGHCALGAALAAYEQWLQEEGTDLGLLLERAFHGLALGFDSPPGRDSSA